MKINLKLILKCTLILLIFLSKAHLQAKNTNLSNSRNKDTLYDPLQHIDFDKVIAFNFNYDSVDNKQLHTYREFGDSLSPSLYYSIKKTSVRILDSATTKDLIQVVSDTSTYGQEWRACFEPRLGFVFFSKNTPVFLILVCFECKHLQATIRLPATLYKYSDFGLVDLRDTSETFPQKSSGRKYYKGFSETGEKQLLAICAKLNMLYCENKD